MRIAVRHIMTLCTASKRVLCASRCNFLRHFIVVLLKLLVLRSRPILFFMLKEAIQCELTEIRAKIIFDVVCSVMTAIIMYVTFSIYNSLSITIQTEQTQTTAETKKKKKRCLSVLNVTILAIYSCFRN